MISTNAFTIIKKNLPHWPHTGNVAPLVVEDVTPLLEDVVVPPLSAVVVVEGRTSRSSNNRILQRSEPGICRFRISPYCWDALHHEDVRL